MRVEYDYLTDQIVVEYYNSSYAVTKKLYISCEMELFGGFYAGEDAYYFVFGQENEDEDDNVEVIRVVKYSKSWKRLGAASLCGADTTIPFDAGSLRMTESGGYLYIHTSHEMYNGHQSNLTIEVDESAMQVVHDSSGHIFFWDWYVSHSFNQFILADDEGNLLALDHGDWYPRSIVMFRYLDAAGSASLDDYDESEYSEYAEVYNFSYDENYHYNYTFASVGGFEYSSSSYLVAGSSVVQDDNAGSHSAYNIFITVTPRDDFSEEKTETKWITSYGEDDAVDVFTPQLVKISNDKFLLMWQTEEYLKDGWANSDVYRVNYVFLDAEGNMTSKIYQECGICSDCQPIVVDGKVTWYTTKSSAPVFFTIDGKGNFTNHQPGLQSPVVTGATSTVDGLKITWTKTEGATQYEIVYSLDEYNAMYKYVDASKGTSYTIPYGELTDGEYIVWVVAQKGEEESWEWDKYVVTYKTVKLSAPKISSVKQSNKTVTLKWSKVTSAKGYYIYRSTSKSSGYKLVKTVTSGSTVSWKDTDSKSNGKTYYYKVYAYRGEKKSSSSSVKSFKYMKGTVSSLTNTSTGIKVKWSKVSGASGYYIYRKAGSGSYKKVKTITKAATVSWTDTSVKSKNGTTYTYYVQPYNSSSKGAYATKKTVRLTAVSLSSVKNSSSKTITVKISKKNAKATGYQIQYSKSKTFASGNKTVSISKASTLSKKITKLTKGKTYYVRVRAYKTVSGKKYYSAWSSKKSVKVSK